MLQYADSSGSKGRHWSTLIVDLGATKKRFIQASNCYMYPRIDEKFVDIL